MIIGEAALAVQIALNAYSSGAYLDTSAVLGTYCMCLAPQRALHRAWNRRCS